MSRTNIAVECFANKVTKEIIKNSLLIQKGYDVMMEDLNTDIAETPCEVVYQEDRVKLKHYLPETIKSKTPLLIVYALINRETMLDLQPERSVIQAMLSHGQEVYMIDWGYPGRKDRYLTIDDHVNWYMDDMVNFIQKRHGLEKINLMGICMGGTFSVMYAALHPDKIKNLVTTVTPTNFDTDKGFLHLWTRQMHPDKLVSTGGNLAGDIMNMGFLLMNPARLMMDKYVGFMDNMANKTFVENFIRMEKWIFDSPDVPGETFKQFITDCYQQNLLIQSKMKLNGNVVDLKNISMPLLNIYAKFDHLVPPEAAKFLTARVGSQDVEDLCLNTGHIGIYVSSKYQKEFTPKIVNWLSQREKPQTEISHLSSLRNEEKAIKRA
ncbi:polyhydroxyalkanoate synthase [Desulfocicer vacuolatum DSM 3385]|uniref:Poly(3-hydroxyalkanoate) polymerase subunit PhaC n=1 Tax=Desulfocicer vacuolatum DSM 3385 TaxID=1121400 RepID=A0A1W2ELD3_9BACT|nr:class III poly(R)-hydroxyalkanoic acid synthase subunit PhaC [Desulfocicer vacuolatum]SMD10529.1 polyhydroxyalkanoate synthase [Desulfocicer vacuolatum DSM 3385]